jgi:hypothetical protein
MRRLTISLALVVLLLAMTWSARAVDGFDLSWWTVDGGGGSATGDTYTLTGTAGQPDAGALTSGQYTLGGGFWGGGALTRGYDLFLPLILKGS